MSEVHTEQSSVRLVLAVCEDLLLTARASQRGQSLTSMILVEEKERQTVGAKQAGRPFTLPAQCSASRAYISQGNYYYYYHHYLAKFIFTLLLSGSTKIELHQCLPLGKHSSALLQYMKLQ